MPSCPYGNHRLVLDANVCGRCGNDLSVYAALQDLPVVFYNRARRLWDVPDLSAAAAWLQAALYLRHSFPEAYWLLAAIELKRGNVERARHLLTVARQLRAPVQTEWLTPPPAAEEPSQLPPQRESSQEEAAAAGELGRPALA